MTYTQQWQLPDGTPNWEKAPTDATHYCAENDEYSESFLKQSGPYIYFITPDTGEWRADSCGWTFNLDDPHFVPRPA